MTSIFQVTDALTLVRCHYRYGATSLASDSGVCVIELHVASTPVKRVSSHSTQLRFQEPHCGAERGRVRRTSLMRHGGCSACWVRCSNLTPSKSMHEHRDRRPYRPTSELDSQINQLLLDKAQLRVAARSAERNID